MPLSRRPLLALLFAAACHAQAAEHIVLNVDASNVAQQIFQVHASIPAVPGELTLLYPQWIPGNHGPSGPLNQLAGLRLSANGQSLEWRRDPVNMFAFHVTVPAGAATVEARYQFLSPVEANQGRITMTREMLGVQWQAMTLYPAGRPTREIAVQANLTLPAGWQFGSALDVQSQAATPAGQQVAFKPLDLETLVDSPLFAGRHFKRIDLDPGARFPVHLNLVADSADSLEATPEQIAPHRALMQQAYKLFGSRHYKHYDFLLAQSDEFGGIGREHQQSSENGVKPGYFSDWDKSAPVRVLLPHELTHSWNGKFRRPAGQDTPDFNTPLQNSLLWVYEGQTQYWGNVLAARSGLVDPVHMRELFAATAARYDVEPGRSWRTMGDTTNDPIINGRRPQGWSSWQRDEDYYMEGALIWLDVDTLIRELSRERRSLDDFARLFFGVNDGSTTALTYTFDDVVAALNAVQPHDWATFLHRRVDGHGPGAPLDGLVRAGWKLVYRDTPTAFLKADEERGKSTDLTYSLGMVIDKDGKLGRLLWDGPAFKAGLSGNTTLLAVNGTAYTPTLLKAAITTAKNGSEPINLLVRKGKQFLTVALDYHGGLKYPQLERIAGTPDRLSAILQPLK
ncbi:M61 family metallopeptidase [Janthinobacterium sp. PC23-8]|uniref:M61 family metallopeptidase n=1 Tax=Janthinobacterium sp. PC23-8 TaxID=2012679 RepID=UPI000B978918|nr:M61 family metallopeptidase [Janthinobacterium sp. PC23-8]OYO30395.1 peptidase M61 [Janthinobacterium sp. PC23-8]